ncbi:MAG TPA: neocarzinostatin apoprotein domain-containing protein, partial [Acidimicrobiales bacterium]
SGSVTSAVYATFRSYSGRTIVCDEAPGGCVVGIGTTTSPVQRLATVPITLAPSVDVTVSPAEGTAEGQPQQVAVAGLEPGASYGLHRCLDRPVWEVDQCEAEPAATVVAGPDGTATATVVARAQIETPVGGTNCRFDPCGIGVIGDGGVVAGLGRYTVVPLTLTVTPEADLVPGEPVTARLVAAVPGASYELRLCASYPSDLTYCEPDPAPPVIVADATGTATGTVVPTVSVDTPSTGRWICQRQGCSVAAVEAGTDTIVATAPYTVALAAVVLTPAAGLVDGQEIRVDVGGLEPGAAYRLLLCSRNYMWFTLDPQACDPDAGTSGGSAFVAGADGRGTAVIGAAQRIAPGGIEPATLVCHPDVCAVAVVDDAAKAVVGWTGYGMAEATLTATPDTGLHDGDTTRLSGTGVMSSYTGPPVWIFTSGIWGVGQCAADIVDDPSIVGVFSRCVVPPGAGPLAVPGSTFAIDVTVAATIDPVLGGPVDCTAGAGACVLAIVRPEADGTITVHAVPIGITAT